MPVNSANHSVMLLKYCWTKVTYLRFLRHTAIQVIADFAETQSQVFIKVYYNVLIYLSNIMVFDRR